MERFVKNINIDWLFTPSDDPKFAAVACDEGGFVRVSLPHTNIELPYHNFSEQEHCFVSWYRRRFATPAGAANRKTFIDFDGAMIAATVYINGRQAAPEHKGGYTPFSVDVTAFLNYPATAESPAGKAAAGDAATDEEAVGGSVAVRAAAPESAPDNVLAVRLDSTERRDIPPFGNVVDYLTFGGIYRDVRIRVVDDLSIDDLIVRPANVLDKSKSVETIVRIVNAGSRPATPAIHAIIRDKSGRQIAEGRGRAEIQPGESAETRIEISNISADLWDLDSPTLYTLTATLDTGDAVTRRFGFRAAEFRDDGGFYLNNRRVTLRGLNRHQTYAYIGQAGPDRLQRKDAEIIRYDLACNIVRTSHYPQSPAFLDRCDEIGLLVLEEIPGWQFIGDDAWKAIALRDVEAMIRRDRHRPAIVLWGARINESGDDHDFYTKTNQLAHRLDPTRQTGGVRYNYESELLEDVFTFNDFNYDLKTPNHPRYVITEFCGHMYPTKTFDQEERVKQHALHHVHVRNQVEGMPAAGAIAWCAFDYNTHRNFGSGDRICYHGVMDIFRQPKFAAYFYAAHADPAQKIVMEIASYWKMGDRGGGGAEPVMVFGNVDEIELFIGDSSRGRFKPDFATYPNLVRPPFICAGIGGVWGGDWKPLTVHGYIDGRRVITKKISNDGMPRRLRVAADDAELLADGADMTRISLRIVDEFDNLLPFAAQPVSLSISGPGTLVGENPFSMPGGRGAVYVRAGRTPGKITVTATTARLATQMVEITTVEPKSRV